MSENRLCFVANFYKTEFFHAWAQAMGAFGQAACWITTNRKLFSWLADRYGAERVLLVNWDRCRPGASSLGDFRLRELVFGDRCLRFRMAEGLRWLTSIQAPMVDFLRRNRVTHVLGEVTWAHEILLHRICRELPDLGCTYLNPHTVRIPNGRFGFFLDEFQTELLPTGAPLPSDEELAKAFEVRKPDYLALNDRLLQKSRTLGARAGKVKRFFTRENIDPLDPTLIADRWLQFRLKTAEEWNKEAYRFVRREPFESIKGQRFAFLALHKQPEASIDVLGRYVEDQLRNIENLWRRLPDGCLLAVKEHTNAIGDRSRAFYRGLQRLPGVVLVDERTDSHALCQEAEVTITVSGTVAYEAALMGKLAWTLAPTFFNRLKGATQLELLSSASRVAGGLEQMDMPDFRKWLWMHSREGLIIDPLSDERSVSGGNLRMLAHSLSGMGGNVGK